MNVILVPIDSIVVPAFLPTREEIDEQKLEQLKASMSENGLLYPLKVRAGSNGTYDLKDGFLRLKSAKMLGWKEIYVDIGEATDEQVVVESLVTNKDRIEEDPFTVAKKLQILVTKFGWTHEQVGKKIGMDRSRITHLIQLLQLSPEVQKCATSHNLSLGHTERLLEAPEGSRLTLAQEVVEHNLSVADLQRRIWDVRSMPHLQPRPMTPPSVEEEEKVRGQLEECHNCHMGCRLDLLRTVGGQQFCPDCYDSAIKQYQEEQNRLKQIEKNKDKPLSPEQLDSWEQKEGRMHPQKSGFEERVVFRFNKWLEQNGLHGDTNREFCVLSTKPDDYVEEIDGLVYVDGVAVHSGSREDKDERLRGLLKKHHDELNIKGFPYKADSKAEEDRVFGEMCRWVEGLKAELAKWETKGGEATEES